MHDGFIRSSAYLKISMSRCTPMQCLKLAAEGFQGSVAHSDDAAEALTAGCVSEAGAEADVEASIETNSSNEACDPSAGCAFEQFQKRSLPLDLATFIKYNELSSIRIKADAIVAHATKNAVQRLKQNERD